MSGFMGFNCPTLHRIVKCAAVAALAAGQHIAAAAEDGLHLQIPSTISYAVSAEPVDDYSEAAPQPTPVTEGVDEVIRERYPDGKVKIERQVTLDADGNYVNDGPWKLFSPTETVIAEGQFKMGKRVGNWTRWLGRNDSPVFNQFPFNNFKAPFASQANFADGAMDGEWLIVDADNKKVMLVSLTEGKRNGLVTTWLPTGKTHRQANYDHGVPIGDVFEADSKTGELVRIATYVDGRRLVTKTAHHRRAKHHKGEELKKSEELFLAATTVVKTPDNFWNIELAEYESQGKDLRHGASKVWFENGKLQVEGFYQHDKRSGTFTYWYKNGQVAATGEYVDDLPNDIWVSWHENGQKAAIGNYRAGALIGDWRWWNEDGKLAVQKTYDGSEATASNPKEVLELSRVPSEEDAPANQ